MYEIGGGLVGSNFVPLSAFAGVTGVISGHGRVAFYIASIVMLCNDIHEDPSNRLIEVTNGLLWSVEYKESKTWKCHGLCGSLKCIRSRLLFCELHLGDNGCNSLCAPRLDPPVAVATPLVCEQNGQKRGHLSL